MDEVLEDPQLRAREMVVDSKHSEYGEYPAIGSPFKFSGTPVTFRNEPPKHGEHTNEILGKLGYTDDQIEELRKKRMI